MSSASPEKTSTAPAACTAAMWCPNQNTLHTTCGWIHQPPSACSCAADVHLVSISCAADVQLMCS
eukprot:6736270-Pyramimonas_sp.AAC.1